MGEVADRLATRSASVLEAIEEAGLAGVAATALSGGAGVRGVGELGAVALVGAGEIHLITVVELGRNRAESCRLNNSDGKGQQKDQQRGERLAVHEGPEPDQ